LLATGRVWIKVVDAAGDPVQLIDSGACVFDGIDSWLKCTWLATSVYAYREVPITIPATGVGMELRLGGQTGVLRFDDMRVLNRSLIDNEGFERRTASGAEDESLHWRFKRSAIVVTDPEHVRSGRRALQLKGVDGQVERDLYGLEGMTKLRISAWIKTGAVDQPTIVAKLGAKQIVFSGELLTSGAYQFVEGCIDKPSGESNLTFILQLQDAAPAYFDDIVIEPAEDCPG
jgi:hypothetical protein